MTSKPKKIWTRCLRKYKSSEGHCITGSLERLLFFLFTQDYNDANDYDNNNTDNNFIN